MRAGEDAARSFAGDGRGAVRPPPAAVLVGAPAREASMRIARRSLAAALLLAAACGCAGNGAARAESATEIAKQKEAAADAILAACERYLAERGGAPERRALGEKLGAYERALEALSNAENALRIAQRAEHVAEAAGLEPGRTVRVRGASGVVRRVARELTSEAARAIRSGEAGPVESCEAVLRAALRALKVELVAMEHEVGE